MGNAKNELWAYSAGERGRNRVRVYQQRRDGKFYLEWSEPVIDPETCAPVMTLDKKKGRYKVKTRKVRPLIPGVTDPVVAKTKADELAAEFAKAQTAAPNRTRARAAAASAVSAAGPTVSSLIDRYLDEVTPEKGASKQEHDDRAARVFKSLLGERPAAELDAGDWKEFVARRRAGEVLDFGEVGDRMLEYDLKFMIAVLNWAAGVKEDGVPLVPFNPWAPERRSQMVMPRERSPLRPGMTDEIREGLIRHAPNWQFELALILGRHTVSRNSSVRQLRWADIDLTDGTVRWRRECDKNDTEITVPLSAEAIKALRAAPRGIGSACVFPSEMKPGEPTPRHTFQTWMTRAKKRFLASVESPEAKLRLEKALEGLGYHAEKRAGVRDERFRKLEPKIQEAIARTNHDTLRKIYDQVEVDDVRKAMQETGLLPDRDCEVAAPNWQQGRK